MVSKTTLCPSASTSRLRNGMPCGVRQFRDDVGAVARRGDAPVKRSLAHRDSRSAIVRYMTSGYGAELRARRLRLGLTQRELARLSGVAQPVIAAMETGRRSASAVTRSRLDAALSVRPSVVLQRHRAAVRDAVARHRGHDAYVIGSVARGDDTPESDIDLMITFDDGTDLVDVLDLTDELERLLGAKVDVVSGRVHGAVSTHARRDAVPL
ncbi:nucleotidyltransferase domain-containing protein [Cellulomonas persica]